MEPCPPFFQTANPALSYELVLTDKVRFLVFDNVGGRTITIAIKAKVDRFEQFSSEAQQLVETVEWRSK